MGFWQARRRRLQLRQWRLDVALRGAPQAPAQPRQLGAQQPVQLVGWLEGRRGGRWLRLALQRGHRGIKVPPHLGQQLAQRLRGAGQGGRTR